MKTVSAFDLAKNYIQSEIIKGAIPPGCKIKEEEISARLGISRPPIREAFKKLEADGLVIKKPNRGVFVAEIKRQDVWEIYTLKATLYEMSLDLAFDHLTSREINRLAQCVDGMEKCLTAENSDKINKYQDHNHKFHNIMITVSGHQRLENIVLNLDNQVKRLSYKSLADVRHLRESCNYHRDIFEAIQNCDRPRALRLTREHVLAALQVRLDMMANS